MNKLFGLAKTGTLNFCVYDGNSVFPVFPSALVNGFSGNFIMICSPILEQFLNKNHWFMYFLNSQQLCLVHRWLLILP